MLVITLFRQTNAKRLQIYHHNNITHRSCGLNSRFAQPIINRCLKWLTPANEQKQELKNIENGRNADVSDYPYTALIYMSSTSGSCTGAIINERWIITAAHCLTDTSPKDYKIYTGLTEFPNSLANYVRVKNIFIHKQYAELDLYYDIGLIELESKLELNTRKVNSVCLPDKGFTMNGPELASFSGWGRTSPNSSDRRLKTTTIKVDNYNALTLESYGMIDGTICMGDSGGPLVQYTNGRAVLIGITCNGYAKDGKSKCLDKLIRFTNVRHNVGWIVETILNNTFR